MKHESLFPRFVLLLPTLLRVPIHLAADAADHLDIPCLQAGPGKETTDAPHPEVRVFRVDEVDPAKDPFEVLIHGVELVAVGELRHKRLGALLAAGDEELVAE